MDGVPSSKPEEEMNNTQLYLSIGIPTLTVILAWVSNRSDNNRLNDKVDKLGDALRSEILALRIDINKDMALFRKEIHEDLMHAS
jgi:hypothetical protein